MRQWGLVAEVPSALLNLAIWQNKTYLVYLLMFAEFHKKNKQEMFYCDIKGPGRNEFLIAGDEKKFSAGENFLITWGDKKIF